MNMPMPYTEPACYKLDLRDANTTGSVCVDQSTWDREKIGDTYP